MEHAGKESRAHIPLTLAYPNSPAARHYRYAAALIGEQLELPVPAAWLDRGRCLHEQMRREVLGT